MTFSNSRATLEKKIINELELIADLKVDILESFFKERYSDMQTAKDYYILKSRMPILLRLFDDNEHPDNIAAREILDPQLTTFMEVYGYNDIVLLNPEGIIIYSVDDFFRKTNLGKSMAGPSDQPIETKKDGFSFSHVFFHDEHGYEMLITAPILGFKDEFIGFIAFEVDMNPIFDFIQDRKGLGQTGETLIGHKIGEKALFLNPLRHNPQAILSITANFGEKNAYPITEAVQGRDGSGLSVDYRGEKVLAAWRYIPSLDWGLVAKIDMLEAFSSVKDLKRLFVFLEILTVLIVFIIALYISKFIANPIKKLHAGTEIIAAGNLDHKVGIESSDEIGRLSRAFDSMTTEINKAQKNINLILDASGEGIYGLDIHGNITFVNPAAVKMIGWELKDIIGKHQHDLLHHSRKDGSPYPAKECFIYAALKDGIVHKVSDEVFWRKDGTSFPVEYISTPIREENREIIGAVVTFNDISERLANELNLKKSEEKHRVLVESSTDAIISADPNKNIIFWSIGAEKMFGYTSQEIVGKPISILTPEFLSKDQKTIFNLVRIKGFVQNYESQRMAKDGRLIPVEISLNIMKDSFGEMMGISAILRDISSRKMSE